MRPNYRIILVGGTPPPHHGVTTYTEYLLGSKLTKSFELDHLDTSDHRDSGNLARLDFTNIYLALKNLCQLVWRLRQKPALVYLPVSVAALPYFRDGLFILITKLLSNARVVIHLHGGTYFRDQFYANASRLYRCFITLTLRNVDVAIVLGKCLTHVFEGLISEVRVIPNGSTFSPGLSLPYARSGDSDISVGFLGTLVRAKGFLDVLTSAPLVLDRAPNVRFMFAGPWWAQEPESQTHAMSFVEQHGLKDHVQFLGPVVGKKKEEFLAQVDIFVFPSLNEGLPLVILEAMASHCPVISTEGVGAISEVVENEINGILVKKGDIRAIADAIVRLAIDPEQRKSLGRAARLKFEQQYTMEKNIARLQEVFLEVILKERKRPE